MSNLFQPPAVLRTPTWYGGPPDESPLVFSAEAYQAEHLGGRSKVRIIASGALIYDGIGPVEIAPSDVPF
ncbi:hypothetical protein LJR066_002680 [Acidovorax sp. LjRoot66]|uniref:hypothetical protein n=1 Tax=unclassified Acidovorax TaxID=2684926 RepID=UPI00070B760D|nr:hypothetical protein [Acidovorax sp. Root219]KRC34397.1 hypothetical protein ASE28_08580 [Acidovorax sp. Root219]